MKGNARKMKVEEEEDEDGEEDDDEEEEDNKEGESGDFLFPKRAQACLLALV